MKNRKIVTGGTGEKYGRTNALDAELLIFTPLDVGFSKQNHTASAGVKGSILTNL